MRDKEELKAKVKEEVQKKMANKSKTHKDSDEEQVTESVVLGMATIAALGSAWAWARNFSKNLANDRHLRQFIDQYDSQKIIESKLPNLLRRFKLINSLSDLDAMEKQFSSYMTQIDGMSRSVDQYVDTIPDEDLSSSFFAISPQRRKKELKKILSDFVKNVKASFEVEMNAKREELLS